MTPFDYILAARVPRSVKSQSFGLWRIERLPAGDVVDGKLVTLPEKMVGFPDYTMLSCWTEATLHKVRGDIVMEDSYQELSKHLPIWLAARGRVLVTGLGLGCVVRGLLANPDVEEIDVVEIDGGILKVVGPEFAKDPRVNLHHADALTVVFKPERRWDFAWHDLWEDGPNLQLSHEHLLRKFARQCGPQGAWAFPRKFKRMITRRGVLELLGAPR